MLGGRVEGRARVRVTVTVTVPQLLYLKVSKIRVTQLRSLTM